jgi:hypothetical protein
VVGGRLSSPPWNLGHGDKEAPHTSQRLNLGKASGDLTIEHQLLVCGVQQVVEGVIPSHEFGLVVSGTEVEVLIHFHLRDKVLGPFCCKIILVLD